MKNEIRDIRVVFLIFSTVIGFLSLRWYQFFISYILILLSLSLLLIAVLSPMMLKPLYLLWMKIARTVARINTKLLLGIVFIFVFIPVGILMRILKKDPMKRKFLHGVSYWESYELSGRKDRKNYEHMF